MLKFMKQRLMSKKTLAIMMLLTLMMSAFATGAAASPPSGGGIDFSTVDGLDINVADVISTGFSFANMFGIWTTVVLGIIIAPVAIGFIIWLWSKLPRLGKRSA